MGWSLGFDTNWDRHIGYGVPAYCDYPGCGKEIDRGLSYVCGGDPYGGEKGCGLFFCGEHLFYYRKRICGEIKTVQLCHRCGRYQRPYKPTPDHPKWIKHVLTDNSWAEWREKYPAKVKVMSAQAQAAPGQGRGA